MGRPHNAYGSFTLDTWRQSAQRDAVQDRGTRDPASDTRAETFPCHPTLLASPLKCAEPVPDDLGSKALQTIHVAGHRMVVEVALYDGPQPLPGPRLLARASVAGAPPLLP